MSLKIRLYLVASILALSLGVAITKAGILQLSRGVSLKELSERQHARFKKYRGFRGNVLDRKGRLLASSVSVDSLYAEPNKMNRPDQVTRALQKAIPSLSKESLELLSSDRSFVWLKRRLDPNEAAQVKKLKLEGIGFTEEEQRFYPNHGLLGQTLGFIDLDNHPIGGIEQAFERYLKPKAFGTFSFQDAKGTAVRNHIAPTQEEISGRDVVLTIDRNIQFAAEEALQKAVYAHHAKGGWAIVMKPKTGEILALANVPLMNPNHPSQQDALARRNNAISRTGEPGSTFKMVTFAAAIDAGVVNLEEKIYCEKGLWNLDYMTIRDVSKKEWLTPSEIFKYSSNIGTFKLAQRVGPQKLHAMIKRLGFGDSPGLGLLEEARGSVSKPDTWHKTRFANVSFGYGIMASPLQLAMLVSTIANGGVKAAPKILLGIQNPDGILENPLVKHESVRILSSQTAQIMTQLMIEDTLPGGSGKRAAIPGIQVAGKTGTAEKLSESKRYDKSRNVSSFAGFAPADRPEIVAIVSIDEPKGIAFGGVVAAPVWKEIVETALLEVESVL